MLRLVTVVTIFAMGCDNNDGGEDPPTDANTAIDFEVRDMRRFEMGGCTPSEEVCDGKDNDCDGKVDADDEDLQRRLLRDPDNCGACGTVCEAPNAELRCQAGECVISACDPGFQNYNADISDGCEADCIVTAGGQELCDEADNDCDGLTDEGVDLDSDLMNCGACGTVCEALSNAFVECIEGSCTLAECEAGWTDLDGENASGCEYRCTVRSSAQVREYCNALDDDCDGVVDEAGDRITPEDGCGENGVCRLDCEADEDCADGERCNEGQVCVLAEGGPGDMACETDADCWAVHPGYACLEVVSLIDLEPVSTRRCVERGHGPMCDGVAGYRCARPPAWQQGDERGRCDQQDNDCDGRVDEDFVAELFEADRQTPRPCTAGLGVCQREGTAQCAADGSATECSAGAPDPAVRDDDACDGLDDDCDGFTDEDFEDAWVQVGDFEVYAFEASRPGATAEVPGFDPRPDDEVVAFVEERACSRAGVLPWADMTLAEANVACRAAGARLCSAAEWLRACSGLADELYPYGVDYAPRTCNGGRYDTDPDTGGNQDEVVLCGALESCERDGVFDLSGNLKEWTDDLVGGLRPVRGGGYESNLPGGLACDQVADLKAADFHHASIGFRCCR